MATVMPRAFKLLAWLNPSWRLGPSGCRGCAGAVLSHNPLILNNQQKPPTLCAEHSEYGVDKLKMNRKPKIQQASQKPIRLASFVKVALTALLANAWGGDLKHTEAAITDHPNILFLIADQWRAQSFGFTGETNVLTPNIDRLAKESIHLTNAVAGLPVCCPSRASIITGQRPLTHGVFMNDVPLDPKATSIAKVLAREGYNTGFIGKWHLNGSGRSSFIPKDRRQGFDYWKVLECTHNYTNSEYFASDSAEIKRWPGFDAISQTEDAQNYLHDHADRNRPFCLFLSWGPPHEPYLLAPRQYLDKYTKGFPLRANVPEESRAKALADTTGYYASCTLLDDCVGSLMKTLRETGLESNTIVIFTSDHGDLLGSHGQWGKQQPYDESIRVPLLIRWPNGFGTGGISKPAPFNSEDFMPTLLGLCRIGIPKSVEGLDYSNYLLGGRDPSDGTALLTSVAPFGIWSHRYGGREFRGIRTPRFTYVRDLHGPWLLFDNEQDPFQINNLVGRSDYESTKSNLDLILTNKLKKNHDEFLPSESYIKSHGYIIDANETVPYTP